MHLAFKLCSSTLMTPITHHTCLVNSVWILPVASQNVLRYKCILLHDDKRNITFIHPKHLSKSSSVLEMGMTLFFFINTAILKPQPIALFPISPLYIHPRQTSSIHLNKDKFLLIFHWQLPDFKNQL